MRSDRWTFVAAGSLLLASCGAQTPSSPSQTWAQVKEQTSCEALNPADCTGAYGFLVTSDGHWASGPSPSGATRTGALTQGEKEQISADASLVAAGLGGSAVCERSQTVPGVADAVDLMDSLHGLTRVFDLGGTPGNTCYRGGRDRAIQLHNDLATLMGKYYPRPFPAE